MKKNLVLGAVLSALVMSSCGSEEKSEVKLVSHIDSVSYALGMNQGSMLYSQLQTLPGDSIKTDAFMEAFQTAMNNDSTAMRFNQDECVKILQQYFSDLDKIRQEEMQKQVIMNKLAADSALQANKAKEGVIETASGLQYKVIVKGNGKTPTKTDVVKVKYTGKLVDGTVFDSSDLHGGQPAQFKADEVIAGWTEALQLMPVGSKYEILLPAELAYGERGTQGILPGSALFFEVELLDIVK